MIKHILAFVAAAQPLRDWRRCATGAAARLAPLRDHIYLNSLLDDGIDVRTCTGAGDL